MYPAGAHARPCPAPIHTSIIRSYEPDTPPRQRDRGHAHHRFVLSGRLLAGKRRFT